MTALIRIDRSWTGEGAEDYKPIRFCSRCGHPSEEPPKRPYLRGRVCDRCGMGMMLSCAREALPGEAAAFMIVGYDLCVTAVSEAGEKLFGREEDLVGRPLLELVSSPVGDGHLARHAGLAAQRQCNPVVMPLRLLNAERSSRNGTLAARIATCGPPRAALITAEPSEFGRR
jgi:hypothetical protein